MWIMDMFVNAEGEKFGFPPGKGVKEVSPDEMVADKGLAVGSLLNQMLANVNQNEVDHFAKRKLQIKQYVRYMDDIVMISDSKAQLREWRSKIEGFMAEKLKLGKTTVDKGITVLKQRGFIQRVGSNKSGYWKAL